MLKSTDHLVDVYYKSVGRGCVLLLNATPDTSGLIPESHVERYKAFGEAVSQIYKNKAGETSGIGTVHQITFARPTQVNHLITMEDIRYGQIIRAYEVEGLANGKSSKLLGGASVGHKKIDVIDTVRLEGLRLKVTQAVDKPVIRSFATYHATKAGNKAALGDREGTEWRLVREWKSAKLTEQWQLFDVDLTPYVRAPGQYEVEIREKSKGTSLKVKSAVAVMAGTEAPLLIKRLDKPNSWNINRTAQVTDGPKGKTSLRIVAKYSGDGTCEGEMYIRSGE